MVLRTPDGKQRWQLVRQRIQTRYVESTIESTPWQGTIVYLQLRTNKEINPAEVVANRTNVAEQYNDVFLNDNELKELW